jgi:hypothetical protein
MAVFLSSEGVYKIICVLLLYVLQLDALTHPFFDELRDPNARLPTGRFLPPLFNFKPHGTLIFE